MPKNLRMGVNVMAKRSEMKNAQELMMKHGRSISEVIDSLNTQLDQALKQNKAHYELGREQQAIQDAEKLAACQAQISELRKALRPFTQMRTDVRGFVRDFSMAVVEAYVVLSRTTDTEALDAAIAKVVDGCAEICAEEAKKIWLQYDRENPDSYQEGWGDCADYFATQLRARGKP